MSDVTKKQVLSMTQKQIEQHAKAKNFKRNKNLALLYDLNNCIGCYICADCYNCTNCGNCKDCHFCNNSYDCYSCYNVYYCTSLSNKQFCILNVQLTEEEYFNKLKELSNET